MIDSYFCFCFFCHNYISGPVRGRCSFIMRPRVNLLPFHPLSAERLSESTLANGNLETPLRQGQRRDGRRNSGMEDRTQKIKALSAYFFSVVTRRRLLNTTQYIACFFQNLFFCQRMNGLDCELCAFALRMT